MTVDDASTGDNCEPSMTTRTPAATGRETRAAKNLVCGRNFAQLVIV